MKKTVSFKFAAALCCVLALAACSKKSTPDLDAMPTGPGAGQAVPGSEQDFAVNVGDRIYFEEDQSTLTAEAQETLQPPGAVAAAIPDRQHPGRRPCRRARHARIQHFAVGPARHGDA